MNSTRRGERSEDTRPWCATSAEGREAFKCITTQLMSQGHKYGLSDRYACRLLGQWRGTQRYQAIPRAGEDELTVAVMALASQHGRYGHKRIEALLRSSGWRVCRDRSAVRISISR